MTEAESLRFDAARCRDLAKTAASGEAVGLLEEMAQGLDRRAQKIEDGLKIKKSD